MKTPPFDERLSKIREWLEQMFQDDEMDESRSNHHAREPLFSPVSRHQFLDFEKNEKTLKSLEFLMQVSEAAEAKCKDRDAILTRILEKHRAAGKIIPNCATIPCVLRFDRSAMDDFRVLAQLSKLVPMSGDSKSDDACTNLDQFLLSITSAIFRHEAENDQKRAVLSSDCQYLRENLERFRLENRRLDEEVKEKRKEYAKDDVQDDLAQKRSETVFMLKKSRRYARHITELKLELHDIRSCDPKMLCRAALNKNDRRNEDLKRELEGLTKKLRPYHSLPTNMELARMKLQEAKYRLYELQKKVNEYFGT